MKTLITITLVAVAFASWSGAEQSAPAKPNIIFILTDDQGYGDLQRHGHPLLKTPHIDRLFDESVRFGNFHVSPSCSPTRAALMTGMHEFRNGVTHTIAPREHLFRGATTLPQLLQTAGYRTGFIGKWHLSSDKGYAPEDRGFDWCSTNVGGAKEHFNPAMIRNGVREMRRGFREDIFFDDAMTFIAASKDKPFFCHLATYSPHEPLAAPEEFIAPFRGNVDKKRATFLGMVANIDFNVGRLLKFLEDRKLDKNTIVVFMNDNGATWGLDVYNAGMRGCKCTIWQGGTRAMSFWRWPGHWQPHTVDNLTAHLDVFPTLCDVAGVSVPQKLQSELEGFSLRPLLEEQKPGAWHDDRMLFTHVGRWPSGLAASHKYAMAGVRQGDYLLLRSRPCNDPACRKDYRSMCTAYLRAVEHGRRKATYTDDNAQFHWGVSPAGRWALFDVKRDPACQHDLATDKPKLVSTLAAAYDRWWDGMYPLMIERGGDAKLSGARVNRPVTHATNNEENNVRRKK
jgi:arylsulfatase A-like enzyme